MTVYAGFLFAGVVLLWYALLMRFVRYVLHRHYFPWQLTRQRQALWAAYIQGLSNPSPPASVTGPPVVGDGGDTG